MSEADVNAQPPGPVRSPIVAIALGIGAMLVGFVVLPVFPVVVVAVLGWWLADDLRRHPNGRLGWLGWTALAVFGVLAVATAVVVTSFDAHFDCGGTLGGFGEAPDAQLDTGCRDGRAWRVVVAAVGAVVVGIAGALAVRRFGAGRSALGVAAVAVGAMTTAVVLLLVVLVTT